MLRTINKTQAFHTNDKACHLLFGQFLNSDSVVKKGDIVIDNTDEVLKVVTNIPQYQECNCNFWGVGKVLKYDNEVVDNLLKSVTRPYSDGYAFAFVTLANIDTKLRSRRNKRSYIEATVSSISDVLSDDSTTLIEIDECDFYNVVSHFFSIELVLIDWNAMKLGEDYNITRIGEIKFGEDTKYLVELTRVSK